MRKGTIILASALAAALLAPVASTAAEPTETSIEASAGSWQMAGLMWLCPNGNWGSIGNGCIKQRLKQKSKKNKNSAPGALTG